MMLAPIYIFPEQANRACKSKVNISQYRINAKDDWFYSSKSGPKMKDPQVIFCVNTCICCHFISLVGRKYLFQVVRNLDESFREMLKWKEEDALICHRRVSTSKFSFKNCSASDVRESWLILSLISKIFHWFCISQNNGTTAWK